LDVRHILAPGALSGEFTRKAPAARQRTRKKRPAIRPRDIERAVEGVQNAGLKVSGVQFYPDGGFVVLTGATPAPAPAAAFDQWKAKRGARPS
jgi:hypothetical protein